MPLVRETLKEKIKVIFEKASYEASFAMIEKMKEIHYVYNEDGSINKVYAPNNKEIAETFKNIFVQNLVDGLVDAIDNYIKSATVIVSSGIPVAVTTAGTAVSQAGTGVTTSTGTGKII